MIRKLREEDRKVYLQMAHDFYHSSAVLHPVPDSYLEATFEECMRGEEYCLAFLLEFEEETAGYALVSKTFSQEAGGYVYWLEELYILERFRSRGLGREFFAYMEETRPKNVKRFRLEVEEENERAAALYARLGYEPLEYNQMVKNFE